LCRPRRPFRPGRVRIRPLPLEPRPRGGRIIPPPVRRSHRRQLMSAIARSGAVAWLALLVVASLQPCAAIEPKPDFRRGDRQVAAYFRAETRHLADACLADVKSKDDWEKRRPELRRQFLEVMGLWPLPPRTDLKAVVTGKVEAERFTVEKLHFQSSPGLYVTGNLYVPKHARLPAPAVLYVCGHAGT